MTSDPLVTFARSVAVDPVGDPEVEPEAVILEAATRRRSEVRAALRSLVGNLDPADAPHEAVRVLDVLAASMPEVVAEAAPVLTVTADVAAGDLRGVALDALFSVAARPPSPDARAAIRDAAERRPAAVADRLQPLVDGLSVETCRGRELRVLATFAPALADVVAGAVPLLLAVAEGDVGERDDDAGGVHQLRGLALDALAALATERPGALPADRLAGLAALEGGTVERGAGRALLALARVDGDAAATVLAENCRQLREAATYRVEGYLASLVDDQPGLFPTLAPAFAEQLVALPSGDGTDALAALADLARECPATVAPGAGELAPLALDYRRSVRTTAALALHHVGRDHPTALPDWARPLADAPVRELRDGGAEEADGAEVAGDADEPVWPLGGLASTAPEVAEPAVERLAAVLGAEYYWDDEVLAGYVAELASGDPDVAGAVVAGVVPVLYDHEPDNEVGHAGTVLSAVLAACPAVAPAATGPFVRARAAAGRKGHHSNGEVVDQLAEEAPDALRAAIESEYGDPRAYVEEDHGWTESRRLVAVELFEAYDAAWSDVNEWLSLSEVREEVRDRPDDEDDGGLLYEVYATVALWGLLNLVVVLSRLGHWLGDGGVDVDGEDGEIDGDRADGEPDGHDGDGERGPGADPG